MNKDLVLELIDTNNTAWVRKNCQIGSLSVW